MGSRLWLALVYTAAASFATPAAAEPALAALRAGDMRKLVLHAAPRDLPAIAFEDPAGGQHRLADWRGQVVVLNFWATWCAPCRQEMPSLDRLQAELGGRVAVLPVATGRNALPAIRAFYAETGIAHLPMLLDPRSELARAAGVMGLPATLVIDPAGREVGRMLGEADWAGPEALALLRALAGD